MERRGALSVHSLNLKVAIIERYYDIIEINNLISNSKFFPGYAPAYLMHLCDRREPHFEFQKQG